MKIFFLYLFQAPEPAEKWEGEFHAVKGKMIIEIKLRQKLIDIVLVQLQQMDQYVPKEIHSAVIMKLKAAKTVCN